VNSAYFIIPQSPKKRYFNYKILAITSAISSIVCSGSSRIRLSRPGKRAAHTVAVVRSGPVHGAYIAVPPPVHGMQISARPPGASAPNEVRTLLSAITLRLPYFRTGLVGQGILK